MKIIDVLGKPCPIPVIESKKALINPDVEAVLVKVDNIVAVQNLEKMAQGYGYGFSYAEKAKDYFEAIISKDGKKPPEIKSERSVSEFAQSSKGAGLVVVISRDTMGEGAMELGKVLIKGFIYSLTELPVPPRSVIFLNSGAHLTSLGANTIDDIKKLEQKGVEILTCGTCLNFFGIQDKLAAGTITNMYGITERMAGAANIINI